MPKNAKALDGLRQLAAAGESPVAEVERTLQRTPGSLSKVEEGGGEYAKSRAHDILGCEGFPFLAPPF